MTFKEKYGSWAIITGASSGIGKAMAFEIVNASRCKNLFTNLI